MHLPTFVATAALASPTPTPTLTGPGDCFVCSEPSDTILIIQLFTCLIILITHFVALALAKPEFTDPKSPNGRTIIAVIGVCYLTTVIHATLKFFLDEWATSRDRPGSFRAGFISAITKTTMTFGPGNSILWVFGTIWFLMWWKQCGIYEESDTQVDVEEEVREVGEQTPLMAGRSDESNLDRDGTDEGRFRVLLKGMWRDGAVTSGDAPA